MQDVDGVVELDEVTVFGTLLAARGAGSSAEARGRGRLTARLRHRKCARRPDVAQVLRALYTNTSRTQTRHVHILVTHMYMGMYLSVDIHA